MQLRIHWNNKSNALRIFTSCNIALKWPCLGLVFSFTGWSMLPTAFSRVRSFSIPRTGLWGSLGHLAQYTGLPVPSGSNAQLADVLL